MVFTIGGRSGAYLWTAYTELLAQFSCGFSSVDVGITNSGNIHVPKVKLGVHMERNNKTRSEKTNPKPFHFAEPPSPIPLHERLFNTPSSLQIY